MNIYDSDPQSEYGHINSDQFKVTSPDKKIFVCENTISIQSFGLKSRAVNSNLSIIMCVTGLGKPSCRQAAKQKSMNINQNQ